MFKVEQVNAREILDSRGNPTVEVDMVINGTKARACVPSGASTGAYEAHELRDGGDRYHGKGVQKVVRNIKSKISEAIVGKSFSTQAEIDNLLIELDGSVNKTNLGANALLGVSLAFAHGCANSQNKSLYEFLNPSSTHLPVPLMNVLNGGAHANNGLNVQEFMLVPVCGGSFSEALRAGSEVFHCLKKILDSKGLSTAVGDEGGFAPKLAGNEEAMQLLSEAVEKAGYKLGDDFGIALDVAATEFYKDGAYQWESKALSAEQLSDIYASWASKYPLLSVEDGFSEDDWDGWSLFTQRAGDKLQLVGDDLFVTNPKRLQQGIDQKSANALLVKVNQIGTLTETKAAIDLAHSANFKTVMSHRSGETEDVTIADLSVAFECHQIKTGSLSRSDRTAKYNQLLRIEEELAGKAVFRGSQAFV